MGSSPNFGTPRQTEKHFFGIPKKPYVPAYDLGDDYEQRFPEDPMGEETGMNARVWRTYLAESAEFDANMVGEARDGLDAMLVFAGLFSAVAASFLVQNLQDLQTDFTQVTANLLSEQIAVQRAFADGRPLSTVSASQLNPTSSSAPDIRVIWANALWVVSLVLALVVALAAVLVKQWLHRYLAFRSGPPGERSYIRHYRYTGMERWQVQNIIGSLPVIMHISLGFFLLGLVIFLIPLNLVLASVVGAITLLVYVMYLVSHILPILYPQCPYQTPFSDFILAVGPKMHAITYQVRLWLVISLEKSVPYYRKSDPESISSQSQSEYDEKPTGAEASRFFKDFRKFTVNDDDRHIVAVEALRWLYTVSSNTSVRSVVLQAIGGLPITAVQKLQTTFNYSDIKPVHEHLLFNCTTGSPHSRTRQAVVQLHTVAERLCRLFLFFPNHRTPWTVAFASSPDSGRLKATYLAHGSHDALAADDYRTFISTNFQVVHHPLVWVRLLQHAHQIGTFTTFEDSTKISAALCRALLPAIWGYIPPSYLNSPDSESEMVPMHIALRLHMPKETCLYLLGMLSQFDHHHEFPLTFRAVSASLEFALHRVSGTMRAHTGSATAHWEIIEYIFRQLHDLVTSYYEHSNPRDHKNFTSFITDFVRRLIRNTGVCDHPLQSEGLIQRRGSVLKVYWATVMKLVYARDAAQDATSDTSDAVGSDWFALLDRATQGTLRELQLALDAINSGANAVSQALSLNANHVFDTISLALTHGSQKAYQIVAHLNCLELFAKYHHFSHAQGAALVGPYITGLKLLASTQRELYITHLHEPQNLHMAMLAIFEWWPYTHPEDISVADLVELRADDPSWDECRRWLKYVHDWAKEDKTLLFKNFKARKLGEEWEWRVLKAYLTDSNDRLGAADWSGMSKLEEAIRSLEGHFARRNAENPDTDSLIIPPTPTLPLPLPQEYFGAGALFEQPETPPSQLASLFKKSGQSRIRNGIDTWPYWKTLIVNGLSRRWFYHKHKRDDTDPKSEVECV